MTSKTHKVGIISAMSVIVAIASIMAIPGIEQNEPIGIEPSDVSLPYEVPFWQGVPTLAMNEAPYSDAKYNEVDSKKYPWLQRLIENSETIVNDREIKEFFDVSDGNYLYKVDGKLYTIHYTDNPTVRLDTHYVKLMPLDNVPTDARNVASVSDSWLQKAMSNPYKWVEISETDLADFKQFSKDGRNISIDETGYNLRYIGADLPELKNAEYKDTLNKSVGIFEDDEHE